MRRTGAGLEDKTGMRTLPPSASASGVQRDRARRFVAVNATDAEDCRELLAMLGLEFDEDEIEQRREAT